MRILIVDDSVTRNRLMDMLSRLPGVEHVHAAASPLEATRAIHSGWPDAVIFDIEMPYGAGPRILEALKTGGPKVLSIVLTNDATLERRQACLQAGADFFFDKTWEFRGVADVIARLALGDAHSAGLPACWTCFDHLPVPCWLYEAGTLAFKAVNDAAIGRYRYSREEFLAMTFADIQLCDGRRDRISSEGLGVTFELAGRQQHRDRNGAMIHVQVAVTPLNHEGGQLGVALAHDISDQIRAEQALAASESRYRDLHQRFEQIVRVAAVGTDDATGALATKIREVLDDGNARPWKI